ncbi:hypothetical protein [Streptomyces sp. TLI_146]|uniref:hypothetical protein n=1 Tax=Streptomyces sp. TLI_146 TaxID=1938858 RepID=UPI000C70D18D|nr:hypothetical protein [Streptomyces sp. TLI_146]
MGGAVVALGVLVAGCGLQEAAGGREFGPASSDLSFSYTGISSGDDTINQTLEIHNTYRQSVVTLLSFTALDRAHQPMPKVKVSTVYGSDRGTLVSPYGYGMDILRFSGPGEHEVADVQVRVDKVVAAAPQVVAGAEPVTTQALDAAGREISRFERFSRVRLTNPNAWPVYVRVAYLVYDQPPEGQSQQVVSVTPIGGLTRVPSHGSTTIEVKNAAATAIARNSRGPAVSIKAYYSQ